MNCFVGDSFNSLYLLALEHALGPTATVKESRDGEVRDLGQAFFEIHGDCERLVFLNQRDINPFFAIVEPAWILAGQNSLAPLKFIFSNYDKYSDDGCTLSGAYGHRLRIAFGIDQIESAIENLKSDGSTRRVVLSFYSPTDLNLESKDIPCNTTAYLKIVGGQLDITVLNRSNDILIGLPYNVFVFRVIQAFIAEKLSIGCGVQRHFTDSLHLYARDIDNAVQVVKSNTCDGVKMVEKALLRFDINHIMDDTDAILKNDITKAKHDQIKILLKILSFIKLGRTLDLDLKDVLSPNNSLNFITYQWLKRKCKKLKVPIYENYEKYLEIIAMKSARSEINSISSLPIEEAISHFTSLVELTRSVHAEIIQIFEAESKCDSLFAVKDTNKLLKYIYLSIAASLIDPYVVSTPFGRAKQQSLKDLAERLDVPTAFTIFNLDVIDKMLNLIDENLALL